MSEHLSQLGKWSMESTDFEPDKLFHFLDGAKLVNSDKIWQSGCILNAN